MRRLNKYVRVGWTLGICMADVDGMRGWILAGDNLLEKFLGVYVVGKIV